MSDTQLYFAVGLPVFAFLINIVAGIMQYFSIMARFAGFESTVNARFTSIDNRFIVSKTVSPASKRVSIP